MTPNEKAELDWMEFDGLKATFKRLLSERIAEAAAEKDKAWITMLDKDLRANLATMLQGRTGNLADEAAPFITTIVLHERDDAARTAAAEMKERCIEIVGSPPGPEPWSKHVSDVVGQIRSLPPDNNWLQRKVDEARLDEARKFSVMLTHLPIHRDSIGHACLQAGNRIEELEARALLEKEKGYDMPKS